MSKLTPLFRAKIKNNTLIHDDIDRWNLWIGQFEGQEVMVSAEKPKKSRSQKQNSYYWSVIIELLTDAMGLMPEEVHEVLKSKFLIKGLTDKNGKNYEVSKSTADLTSGEFEDYLSKCRMWAAQELNTVIPLPREVLQN